MSITAVSAANAHAVSSIQRPTRPESAEVRGAPDHDGDSDDRSATAVGSATAKYNLVDRFA